MNATASYVRSGADDSGLDWRLEEGGDMLTNLWTGLFVVYTAAALPLLVWAVATVVG